MIIIIIAIIVINIIVIIIKKSKKKECCCCIRIQSIVQQKQNIIFNPTWHIYIPIAFRRETSKIYAVCRRCSFAIVYNSIPR